MKPQRQRQKTSLAFEIVEAFTCQCAMLAVILAALRLAGLL